MPILMYFLMQYLNRFMIWNVCNKEGIQICTTILWSTQYLCHQYVYPLHFHSTCLLPCYSYPCATISSPLIQALHVIITSYGHTVTSYRHSPVTWTSDPTLHCHLSNLALLSLSHSIHILSLCMPLTPTPVLLHSILTFFCSESIHQACIHTGCVGEGKYVHSVVCEMSHSLDYHWSAVETISNHSSIGPLHLVLQRPISTDGRWGPAHHHIRGRGHLETGIGRSTWAGWAGVVGRSMLCWNGGQLCCWLSLFNGIKRNSLNMKIDQSTTIWCQVDDMKYREHSYHATKAIIWNNTTYVTVHNL